MADRSKRLCLGAGAAGLLVGALVAIRYAGLGLSLTHYDARGHLVVARRIFDSITPGWRQIGAVWLPLPHLLNALPVQVDAFYRTGASAIAISVLSFAATVAATAMIALSMSGSWCAAVAAALVLLANPSLLYLQSTPMTEPLLLGLSTTGVALLLLELSAHSNPGTDSRPLPPSWAGVVLALACLTRYEAWPVTAAALVLAMLVRLLRGEPWAGACRRVLPVAIPPAVAGIGFMIFSRLVVGEWFVAGGFFVPENPALGKPFLALSQIAWGARELHGSILGLAAITGAVWIGTEMARGRRTEGLVALSLGAVAALPWLAYVQGHPYRIRYAVALAVVEAVAASATVAAVSAWSRRAGILAMVVLAGAVALDRPPLARDGAMVVEAQWDTPNIAARREVTGCLRAGYAGDTIMASMGSLGHYMQEMSGAGFAIGDFLHEGNGDIWLGALENPRPFAGWILIEEKAEGGDMLARRARENPRFLDGFSRVCEAAGVALYQRQNRMLNVAR